MTTKRAPGPKPTHYKVLCVSMYTRDIDALDVLVKRLKAAGWRKANRSHLLRLALAHLDEASIQAILRTYAESEPDPEIAAEAG